MKKRLISFLLAAVFLLTAGCGSSASPAAPASSEGKAASSAVPPESDASSQPDDQPSSEPPAESADPAATSDALVVFFSRTGEQYGVGVIDKGNTAIVAEMIAEQTGADLFEILPAEGRYPTTYDELTDVAKQELSENARPEITSDIPDLAGYDTIFIGAPVWWGDWPMIMYTFFEENEEALVGKTLIPFSTHAGSGLSGFDKKLADACPMSEIGTGLAVAGVDAQNDPDAVRQSVNSWLTDLGYE